jgi:hypothetical protein
LQERFVAQNGAELLGPIVACDPSRERKQPFSVAACQNQPPTATARIASVEFN